MERTTGRRAEVEREQTRETENAAERGMNGAGDGERQKLRDGD